MNKRLVMLFSAIACTTLSAQEADVDSGSTEQEVGQSAAEVDRDIADTTEGDTQDPRNDSAE